MMHFLFVIFLTGAALIKGQSVEVTPREEVRRAGDDVTVLCKVAYPIDSCRMTVGTQSYRLIPSNQEGDVVYSGQGLQYGECGAHIKNIREEWNGNVTCVLPPQTGNIEIMGFMRLIVARAPTDPKLYTPDQSRFREGDPFMAQCVVQGGRPVARISWFLDEEPLLIGPHQPIVSQEPKSDLLTIAQNLTRTLIADDNGRRLVCRSEHQALPSPRYAARQIIVEYPPKRLEAGPITIFGLKLNEEGRINVTVRSNPAPDVEWTVGDQRLVPGQTDNTANIQVLDPINLGGSYYNCTLVLLRVSKEDVERTYFLRVRNELGSEEFAIRMSTMDEPAGVELEAGAIVGIVIAVLVLLIAIFLIVFAKATDRWCFAGGRRRDAKNSGESAAAAGDVLLEVCPPTQHGPSDTESAVGGTKVERSRLAELGARVRAALPRPKDKVQATETPAPETEDKAQAEEKKGIVYAELALGDQQAGEKPPPPSAEYAEIVYTNQEQPKE